MLFGVRSLTPFNSRIAWNSEAKWKKLLLLGGEAPQSIIIQEYTITTNKISWNTWTLSSTKIRSIHGFTSVKQSTIVYPCCITRGKPAIVVPCCSFQDVNGSEVVTGTPHNWLKAAAARRQLVPSANIAQRYRASLPYFLACFLGWNWSDFWVIRRFVDVINKTSKHEVSCDDHLKTSQNTAIETELYSECLKVEAKGQSFLCWGWLRQDAGSNAKRNAL